VSRRKTASQTAITRAVKAVVSAGLKVARVETDGERVIVVPGESTQPATVTALEKWRARRAPR
jgi:hypothetical protein